jgi:hypothetical protein
MELQSTEKKKRGSNLSQSTPDLTIVLPEGGPSPNVTSSSGHRGREKKLESHGKRKSARFRSLSGVVSDGLGAVVSNVSSATATAGGLISTVAGGDASGSAASSAVPSSPGESNKREKKLRTRTPSNSNVHEKEKRSSRHSGTLMSCVSVSFFLTSFVLFLSFCLSFCFFHSVSD